MPTRRITFSIVGPITVDITSDEIIGGGDPPLADTVWDVTGNPHENVTLSNGNLTASSVDDEEFGYAVGTRAAILEATKSQGGSVASAAALNLPAGRVFHITGTTNVTSITGTAIKPGWVIVLIFDGILTFTDGNNLKLAGNFVTAADSTITLAYDGTNFYECARSVN